VSTSGLLSREDLRALFLFEQLGDEQLDWIVDNGDVVEHPAGAEVAREGETAECFYVLLDGEIRLSRAVRGDDVELMRGSRAGVYAGATQFYLGDQVTQTYSATLRALTDVRLLALPAPRFAAAFGRWFPMAVHLLQGMFVGIRNSDEIVGQREKLLALGKLSAGLMHELNNPAAAAARATQALRERVAGMRSKLAKLADGRIDGEQLRTLTELQDEFVETIRDAPALSAMETSDREDELGEWLDERGVAGSWDLAAVFVGGGLDTSALTRVELAVEETFLEPALRWLAYTVETETIMSELIDASGRISTLVGAARQYSQMDRAPSQVVDLHEGLDSTLVMLGRDIGPGIDVVKDYDRTLPRLPVYPAELNQVWTNLIDNAVDAMGERGTLTVRTARDGGDVLVEIGDTGPGVPAELRRRVFEPFFTTKGVGEGTGLGLDVSWRIVVTRHGGDLRVVSEPGDTRFQVRLPLPS
jgi:signal transduction histidine kinase